jgi:aminopeptidase N
VKVQRRSNRFGQERGVVFLGNALPLLDVQQASGPTLNPYTDIGDPFYSLVAGWSVRLDVPAGLTAATTGELQSRQPLGRGFRRLQIVAPEARDFAIVLGRFTIDSTITSGGVRLRRYRVAGQRRSAARRALRVARTAVETYTSWYGPPGESEIDLMPGPGAFGTYGPGMEYPGLVLTPNDPHVVAHELAHQWWYGLVGDDQWRSPWLDESFAEFSALRLPASVVPRSGLRCNYRNPVRPFGGALLTASMKHWERGADSYFLEVYLGGTCALRSLEHDLGRPRMTAFLRSYVDAHRFGVVTTGDFVAALRAAAPAGYDVDAFLRRARIVAR